MKSKLLSLLSIALVACASVSFESCSKDEVPSAEKESYQSSYDGHECVDMGLPSGTRWAKQCIVGLNNQPVNVMWGHVAPLDSATIAPAALSKNIWKVYDYCTNGDSTKLTKYTYLDGLRQLDSSDDFATQNWGSHWETPTLTQIVELVDTNYTTIDYDKGTITSKKTGNVVTLNSLMALLWFGNEISATNEYGTMHAGGGVAMLAGGRYWLKNRYDYDQAKADCFYIGTNRNGNKAIVYAAEPRYQQYSIIPVVKK